MTDTAYPRVHVGVRVIPDPYGRPERNRAELEWLYRHKKSPPVKAGK